TSWRGPSWSSPDCGRRLARAVHARMVAEVCRPRAERLVAPDRRDRGIAKVVATDVRGSGFLVVELLDVPHTLGRDHHDLAAALDDDRLVALVCPGVARRPSGRTTLDRCNRSTRGIDRKVTLCRRRRAHAG